MTSTDTNLTAAAKTFLAGGPDYPEALDQLTATAPAGLPGLLAQAEVLAHLIGADDPNPDPQQLLARRIRDALHELVERA